MLVSAGFLGSSFQAFGRGLAWSKTPFNHTAAGCQITHLVLRITSRLRCELIWDFNLLVYIGYTAVLGFFFNLNFFKYSRFYFGGCFTRTGEARNDWFILTLWYPEVIICSVPSNLYEVTFNIVGRTRDISAITVHIVCNILPYCRPFAEGGRGRWRDASLLSKMPFSVIQASFVDGLDSFKLIFFSLPWIFTRLQYSAK